MNPTGSQFWIKSGHYRAVITQVGACLRGLWYDQRPLIVGFDESDAMPLYRGAILAPWPNRIGAGRYRWGDVDLQLPINEPQTETALHGLVAWLEWTCDRHQADSVALSTTIRPQPGYPFLIGLIATYTIGNEGLVIRLSAENLGPNAAPYGCSIHPYLSPGPGSVDDWSLELPAERYLTVDADHLLPVGSNFVESSPFDFRQPRILDGVAVDNAFTDLTFDDHGLCHAAVSAGDGTAVVVAWDKKCQWVQIHTADRPEPQFNRVGVVVEPMTCPPNAFQSGEGIVRLEPGGRHDVRWRIAVGPGFSRPLS